MGWLNIVKSQDGTRLIVELFGEIYYADGGYEAKLAEALRAHDGPVTVLINSPGGEVTAGLSMHGMLASYRKGEVVTHNIAQAASAGALVFAAGHRRLVSEGAVTMIHRASSGRGGTSSDLEETARMLASFDRAQAALLSTVTGKSVDEISALLAKTEWMTAEQTIELGLATETVTADQIAARAPNLHPVGAQATIPHMTLREKLGLPADATEEQVVAALDALLATKPAVEAKAAPVVASTETVVEPAAPTPAADPLADLDARIASAIDAALAAREAKAAQPSDSHAVAVAAVVDSAIAAGRLTPATRAKAIQACGTTAQSLDSMRQLWAVSAVVTPSPVKTVSAQQTSALTETQKMLAQAAGMTEKEWLAAKAAQGKV